MSGGDFIIVEIQQNFCLYQVMEIELKKLMDTVNSIYEEMFYLQDR